MVSSADPFPSTGSRAAASGGVNSWSQLSTAAVLAAVIKATPGQVYSLECFNNGAEEVFIRLYNQTGVPGVGDAAAILWRGMIPGSTTGSGFTASIPVGRAFSAGIGIRVSGAVADNDATVLAANQVIVNVGYK